ncbi:hypothetical protein QVO32_09760, partial [Bacteroides gallinaceum]|uniref:hypothetical protein n=1 Tax=Bacteroides gallinaceum TaxID=1462571 RepID=UPI0025AA326D
WQAGTHGNDTFRHIHLRMYFFTIATNNLRSCFEFLQKVFLGLMCSFSCVLWAINSKQLLKRS